MSGGGAGKGGAAAAGPVPAAARRMVQSLKEIVNRPEAEIYAALRECDMDPDEAVNRLLSQDTFQEVKTKRDKKKEVKETPEPRSRAASNTTNRGVRGGGDRSGRNSSFQSSSNDNMSSKSSILGPAVPASNFTQKQAVPSSSTLNKSMFPDGPSVSLQPSSGFQHSWSGMPGHMSMADVVKMGRPQGKPSGKPVIVTERAYAEQNPPLPTPGNQSLKQSSTTAWQSEFDHELPGLQDRVPQVMDASHAAAAADDEEYNQQAYENDWSPLDEPPSGSQLTLPEASGGPSLYVGSLESSKLVADAVNLRENSHADENSMSIRSASASDRHLENPEDSSGFNDGLLQNTSTYQSQVNSYKHDEVEDSNVDVSSAATNFQHLSLHNEELVATKSAEDNPAVIIPDHLQVTNADCAHLSFGSFVSGAFSGFLPPKANKNNAEEQPVVDDSPPVHQIEARNQDYYDNGQLNSLSNENVGGRTGTTLENLDVPSVSQPDALRQAALDASDLQYNLPSVSSHAYSNTTQTNAMEGPQGNTQPQNLSPFSSLLQANSLHNSLLAPNIPPLRDLDFSLAPLLAAQSVATKYNTAVPSTSGPAMSMQEAVKAGVFSNTQPTQNLPSTSIPTGPPLPQQLPVHPYPQPTLPLGPFANLIGYQYLPQSYTYLPSAAFQQAYSSNGPFHQSAAAVPGAGMKYSLPQYKSSLSAASLPQPSSMVSGYGGFESSSNMPGNFGLNQSTASAATTLGFDEALSTQYKDASHYMALQQQNDNSAMWLHGTGSRALSALPAGNFYGYQGQSQQGGFRQGQQPSQYGGLGYPNFYHSQAGLAQEHVPNPPEGSLNGSQAAPSQPSHQIWQHSY